MLLNDYINKLDYDEEMLVNEACGELTSIFDDLPVFCESANDYQVFCESIASGFVDWVKKVIDIVRKFFTDIFDSIASAFKKKDVDVNLAKFKKLSAEDQKKCIKALKEKKLTDIDVDKFEKAVKAIQSDLEKAYEKYETMKFKDSEARDAYVKSALDTAMKKLQALDDLMDAKIEKAVDEKTIADAEGGAKGISKKFDNMISSITDSMDKIGKKESSDANKDVDKTSGRKSFVLAFKNLARTARTGLAKHGKAVIGVASAIGIIAAGIAAHKTGLDAKAANFIKGKLGKKGAEPAGEDTSNPNVQQSKFTEEEMGESVQERSYNF